jgi:cytochrome c peroxidase
MRKCALLFLLAAVLAFYAFRREERAVFSVPKGWPAPVYDFRSNPLTPAKIEMGRMLFFEPALSRDGTISCGSCHLPQTAFTHIDHDLSHGIEGRIGLRNSPALMNLAWSKMFMWDGAVHNLDVQSLAPITHHDEMDETIAGVVNKLQQARDYPGRFAEAFGDTAVTGERVLKSLSQFMLTLVSAGSKYDRVMRGDAGIAFNAYEERGYQLFRTNCADCHREPLFTNGDFENNGLTPDTTLNDAGRFRISGLEADRGKFKVPTLRNIEVSYPYMHDGRFRNLQMVLFHYTNGIHQSATVSPRLKKGLELTEDDKRDIILFLKTLTDEQFLHNPAFQLSLPGSAAASP